MKTVLFTGPGIGQVSSPQTFVKHGNQVVVKNIYECMKGSKKFRLVPYPEAEKEGLVKTHRLAGSILTKFRQRFLYPEHGILVFGLGGEFDLVHVSAFSPRITNLNNTPLILTHANSMPQYLREAEGWGESKIAGRLAWAARFYKLFGISDSLLNPARASKITLLTHASRKAYLNYGVPAGKVETVYPSIDIPSCTKKGPDSGCLELLFIAIFYFREKGGFNLIKAFRNLKKRYPNIRLTVITHEKTIPKLPEVEGMRCLAPLPRERLFSGIYPNTDIIVMPFIMEGDGLLGQSQIESMGFGLPMVTTYRAEIEGIEAAQITVGKGVKPLEEGLESMLVDENLRLRLGKKARKLFLNYFTPERQRRALEKIYSDALRNPAPFSP